MRVSDLNNESKYDCLIVGAGYSGTILATILARQGRDVLLIDRHDHPRFAIGESSTPIADMLLQQLGENWDIPELESLARYGRWLSRFPNINCGLKRGFTYFRHSPGEEFQTDSCNANQMLVAASANEIVGDTHWHRSDLDHYLVDLATRYGAQYRSYTEVTELCQQKDTRWVIQLAEKGNRITPQEYEIRADFIVDASGRGGVLKEHLSLPDITQTLRTNTQARFAHCADVPRCGDHLMSAGIDTSKHPYDCDAAAVHHLLEDGWLWMLRFRDDQVSIGRVWRNQETPLAHEYDPDDPFDIANYPTLARQLKDAVIVAPGSTPLQSAGRLQHRIAETAGDGWALLPSAAATLDPLHSSGIAHGLAGVARLATILTESYGRQARLAEYRRILDAEIEFMDLLIAGAYRAMPHFDAFCSYSLLYFVGAIACEERLAIDAPIFLNRSSGGRSESGILGHLWSSGDSHFALLAKRFYDRIVELTDNPSPSVDAITKFRDDLRSELAPWKQIQLFGRDANRMYRYTTAPKTP